MFKQMQKFLSTCTAVTIILAEGKGEAISVTVIPKPKQTGDGAQALSTPLHLEGTPAELDEQFADLLTKYQEARQSLVDQMEATTAVLAAAKAEQAKKSTNAVKKAASPSKAGTVADDDEGDEGGCGGEGCGENKPHEATAAAPQVAEDNLFA
jgi:PRTRC genetic system protein E